MTTYCRQGRCKDRENPFGSSHFKVRANDWDPIRAEHYGQRPDRPHKQAGHMTAPDQCCSNVRKFLPRRRPHMTHKRHWLCTAAIVLMPVSAPIKILV